MSLGMLLPMLKVATAQLSARVRKEGAAHVATELAAHVDNMLLDLPPEHQALALDTLARVSTLRAFLGLK